MHLDFSNAFVQANLPEGAEVYLELPQRYKAEGDKILKLHKSLYGQIEAPLLWFTKLKEGLITRGLKPSSIDPCLFIGKKVIAAVYVDDIVFFARNNKDIYELIETFKTDGDQFNWEHTIEGDLHSFLGVKIAEVTKTDANVKKCCIFKFTQKGLIEKVLKVTGMQDCNAKEDSNERN